MKLKRFVSCMLLVTLLLVSCADMGVYAAESINVSGNNIEEAKLLSALKIIEMPDVTLDWNKTDILNKIFLKYALNISSYNDEMLYSNLALPTKEVAKTDADYHKYAYVYSMGYLKDETGVAPNKKLNAEFAVSVLKGISGYGRVAENGAKMLENNVKLSLLKGVDVSSDGYISLNGAIRMLFNAIDIPYCEIEYLSDNRINYKVSKDVTVLTKNRDIYEISGTLEATSITSVNGAKTDDYRIRIDDTVFDINDFSYNSLIGRNVTGYAIMDGETNEILYLEPDSSTDDLVINGTDFVSYEPTQIKYYDASGKLKSKNINNPIIIYNGKRLNTGEYSDELFDIVDGDVTLVKNGGNIDVIIINKYKNMIVGTIDKDDKIVTDMFHNNVISFDCDISVIKSETGRNIEFNSIRKKNIITYLMSIDGEYINAVVGGVYMTEPVEEITSISGSIDSIKTGNKNYEVAAEFKDIVSSIEVGQEYDIFINVNDRVVAVKEPSTLTVNVGYLTGAKMQSGISAGAMLKMLTPDSVNDDDYLVLNCANKVMVDGTSFVGESIINAIKEYNGTVYVPISYKINGKNEVYEIDTPNYVATEESDKSLMLLHSRNDSMVYAKSVISNGYRNHYDGKYYLSFDGICVNHATGSDKIVVIDRVRNDSKIFLDIYGFGKESPLVYFAVVNDSSSPDTALYEDTLKVVKKILRKNNAEEIESYFVTLVGNGIETEMQIANDYSNIVNKVDKFDLVRYKLNAKNQITAFEKVLDYSERDSSIGYENYSWDANNIYRIAVGKIYDVLEDGACTVSSYKNMISFYKNKNDIENSKEVIFVRNAYIYKVERDDVIIEPATADDIRTYKDYGDKADMICMTTAYMIPSLIYIIRNGN